MTLSCVEAWRYQIQARSEARMKLGFDHERAKKRPLILKE